MRINSFYVSHNKLEKVCQVDDCSKKVHSRRYCKYHHRRFVKYGIIERVQDRRKTIGCKVLGCPNPHEGLGYCQKHHYRFKKYGDPLKTAFIIDPTRPCKVKGCNKKYKAKGYCDTHYKTRYNPTSGHNKFHSIEELLAMKIVRKRDNNTCQWYGCGRKSIDGYTIDTHHIFPRTEYPEYRFIERYMICYCREHHAYWHEKRGDDIRFFNKYRLDTSQIFARST